MSYTVVEPHFIFLTYAMGETAEALRALTEVRRLSGVSEERQLGVVALEWRSIIRELKASLTASANISKILWPSAGGEAAKRGKELRKICQIPYEHGLKSRKLRNHIEHMDERLDDWVAGGPRPFLTTELVHHVRPDWPAASRAESADACLLVYDVAEDTAIFLGHRFSLAQIEEQVLEIQGKLSLGIEEIVKGWSAIPSH